MAAHGARLAPGRTLDPANHEQILAVERGRAQVRPILAVVLLAAGQSNGCQPGSMPYTPCGGKTCGEACTVCAPGAPDCVETADIKACTLGGQCVPAGRACPMGPQGPCADVPLCDPTQPCYGKQCGEACHVCPAGDPTCVEPAVVEACTADGVCLPVGTYCPGPSGSCTTFPGCT